MNGINELEHAQEHWSPTTRSLTTELPELIDRMHCDGFTVRRVMINPADWDDTPRRAEINGDTIRIGTFTTQHRNTITVVDDTGQHRVTIRHT